MYGYVQRVGAIIKKSQSDNYPTVSVREREREREREQEGPLNQCLSLQTILFIG